MTHSLHRLVMPQDLKNDFIVMLAPSVLTIAGSKEKIIRHLEIVNRYEPQNIGGIRTGTTLTTDFETILSKVTEAVSTYNACIDSEEKMVSLLKELKEAENGMSIVVAGEFERVFAICKKAGIKPHTVNQSLGVWGKTELLPEPEVLAITSMCGHGMIASELVKKKARAVLRGVDPIEAAKEVAKPCHCALPNVALIAHYLCVIAKKYPL